jgi:1-acyl-sn-glycerol-3-phosphate acyltransferase
VKKLFFWPYQLYAWFVLIPLAALISFVLGWLAVLVAVVVNPRFSSRYVAMNWARILSWLTPMRVSVEGSENVDRTRSYVVVANHSSQFDILALYGYLDLDLKWVIKKELRNFPGLGIGCEKVGHIFVDRQNPEAARRSVNEALERLGDGVGILFFPEGTRSEDGRLLPFKKGAFRIAIDEQMPVLPVTIIGTRAICPAKTLRIYPGKVRLVVHQALETNGMAVDDMPDLIAAARAAIESAVPEADRH